MYKLDHYLCIFNYFYLDVLLLFTFCGGYVGSIASPTDGQTREQNTTTDSNDYYNLLCLQQLFECVHLCCIIIY